jgi:hypothetical protein
MYVTTAAVIRAISAELQADRKSPPAFLHITEPQVFVNDYQEAVERYVRHNAGHSNRRSSRKNPITSGFCWHGEKDICYAK